MEADHHHISTALLALATADVATGSRELAIVGGWRPALWELAASTLAVAGPRRDRNLNP